MKHYIEQRIAELEAEFKSAQSEFKKAESKSDFNQARDLFISAAEIAARVDELRRIPISDYPDTTGGEGAKYGKKKRSGIISVGGSRATD